MTRGLLSVMTIVVLFAAVVGDTASAQGHPQEDCPLKNGETSSDNDKPISPPIELAAVEGSQQRLVNFGADRDPERIRGIRIRADRALPRGFEERVELYADPIVRTGDTLESVAFPDPSFSRPTIQSSRYLVFNVCLDPAPALPAGNYTGLVTIAGPEGVNSTTVGITANAKNAVLFLLGLIGALATALVFLLFRGASDRIADTARVQAATAAAQEKINAAARNPKQKRKAERAKARVGSWRWGAWQCLKDPSWGIPTIIAIAAAGGVLYTAYEASPSWGASGLSSALSLVGTAFAAVGGKTFLASLR